MLIINHKITLTIFLVMTLLTCNLCVSAAAVAPSVTETTDVLAAPPANDNFAGAQVVSGASGATDGTLVGATAEPGEQRHAGIGAGRTVWYTWNAPSDGNVDIIVVGSNTIIAAYAGTTLDNLTPLAYNDNRQETSGSEIRLGVASGQTYRLAIDCNYVKGVPQPAAFSLVWNFSANVANNKFIDTYALAQSGESSWTNLGADKEVGEPVIAGNPGGKSIWFSLSPSIAGSYTFSTKGSRSYTGAADLDTMIAVYTGNSIDNLTLVGSNDDYNGHTSQVTVALQAGSIYHIAVDGHLAATVPIGNIHFTWGITKGTRSSDFDGDGNADVAVYRPSISAWYSLGSIDQTLTASTFGTASDTEITGDFDGDGLTDLAVFRPTTATWYVLRSSDHTLKATNWGLSSDFTVPGDYDGDGKTDLAVFRPAEGTWYIDLPSGATHFGQAGDIPVPADYDGDNITDLAVFRPATGAWYIRNSSTGAPTSLIFGLSGDDPVPADYDGDGLADVAVYRPSDGVWYDLQSRTGSLKSTNWGNSGDIPVPANYDDNTRRAEIAVFRISTGTWYILPAVPDVDHQPRAVPFGLSSDLPTSSSVPLAS